MNNKMVDVSIIIVNWNTADLLDQCLKSIFDSTRNISYEIIVVDNASSDNSVEMVKEKYPQAKLICNDQNVGFARANNQAIRESSGRYYLLLNSDTIVLENAFETLVKWMDENPNCGACGPILLNEDGTLQASWAKMPTIWTELIGIHVRIVDGRDYSKLSLEELSNTRPFEVDWVGGACLMVRKSVVDKVGLMDEGYFMYCEETDWCWRIKRAGFSVYFIPASSVIHLGGKSSKITPYLTMARMEYSRLRFLWRYSLRNKILMPFVAGIIFFKTLIRFIYKRVKSYT